MKIKLKLTVFKTAGYALGCLLFLASVNTGIAQSRMSDNELSDLIASCNQGQKTWLDSLVENSYRSRGLGNSYETEGSQDCGRLFPVVLELQRRQATLKGQLDERAKDLEQLKGKQVALEADLANAGSSAAADAKRSLETIKRLRQRVAALSAGDNTGQTAAVNNSEEQQRYQRIEEQNQKLKSEIAALREARAELLASISDNDKAAGAGNEELSQLKNQLLSLKGSLSDRDVELERAKADLVKAKNLVNRFQTKADELQGSLRKQQEKNPDQQMMLELETVRRAKLSLELDLKAAEAETARLTMIEGQARGALEAASSHNMQLRGQIETLQTQLAQAASLPPAKATSATTQGSASEFQSELHGKLMKELDDISRDVNLVEGRAVLGNRVLFEKGSAELSDDGKAVLHVLAGVIKKVMKGKKDWVLQIDGHTDSDPISNEQYPSNWYLASGRSIAVVRALVSNGIKSHNLSAVSFAEFQPRDKRDTSKAKAINRRIELRLSDYKN